MEFLLNSHGARLYSVLLKLTLSRDAATDLFQELFVRLAGSATFDAAHDPAAYAFRVAINLAMEWRRRRPRELPSAASEMEAISAEPSPLAQLIHAEEIQRLLDALSSVSEASREIFVLRMIERESYAAIAMKTGKTEHQARGLCYAAMQQLRQLLAEKPAPVVTSFSGESHG